MREANYKFPNFLGIGAMRSGTSWLYQVLKSHPEIFMPNHVKELHFFDKYYDRGISWYRSFFSLNGAVYKAGGEITPMYLYNKDVPARVQKHLPNTKFIVLLRNPVQRAYSHFRMAFFEGRTRARSFSDFIKNDPTAFDRGLYAAQLRRWFEYFPADRFLILISDEVFQMSDQALASIASFLGVQAHDFDRSLIENKANPSNAPKLPELYHAGIKLRNFLRRNDFNRVSSFVVNTGSRFFKFLGSSKNNLPPLDENIEKQLLETYQPDILDLEKMLTRDLSLWQI